MKFVSYCTQAQQHVLVVKATQVSQKSYMSSGTQDQPVAHSEAWSPTNKQTNILVCYFYFIKDLHKSMFLSANIFQALI